MTRKELRLLISAHNATRAAFHAISADLRHLRDELHRTGVEAERSMGRARSALGGLMGMMRGMGGILPGGGLAGIVGGLGAGAAVGGFAKLGLDANRFRENTLSSLQAMLKSRRAAEDLFGFLSKFADRTPFDDEEIIQAGKSLLTFGFDVRRTLSLAGDAAFSLKVPIDQVVHALAKLQAGSFDIAEMAPVGITRSGLESFGAKFNKSGEPTNRDRLLPAGMALLQQRFGGAMGASAGGFDQLLSTMVSAARRVARQVNEALFGSLKSGFQALTTELEAMLSNGRLIDSLRVIFDAVGRSIELAAAQLPKLISWLERVARADQLRLLGTNVIAFGMTVAQTFADLSGIDFGAIFDPKKPAAWMDALGLAIADGVNGIFGMARVMQELGAIAKSAFADVGDFTSDWIEDTKRELLMMFLSVQLSINQLVITIVGAFKGVADAWNGIAASINNNKTFKAIFGKDAALPTINTFTMGQATRGAMQNIAGITGELAAEGDYIDAIQLEREARSRRRDKADPFRHDPFGTRISDAFTGKNRDTSAQDNFWKRFEKNRMAVAGALFAKPGSDIAPPHQMFGLDPKRPPTVNGVPVGSGGLDPKALERLTEQEDLLKAQAGAWAAIVEASRAYADTLGDHERATRGVLQSLLGHLAAANQLRRVQEQLLQAQPAFTKEWADALTATNQTAKEISGIQGAIRDLLFDTTKLKEATGVFSDLFSLGKDANFRPDQMQAIAAQQFQLLMQTLAVERARLGTLEQGSAEWLKQQRVVIATIGSILKLKKELGEANGFVDRQQLRGFARTPFGIRGAGAEPGAMRGDTDLGRLAGQLLGWALNPKRIDLNAEAQRVMGGGIPAGGISPNGAAQAGAAATSQINVRSGDIYVTATDYQAIRSKVLADVDARLGQAFGYINNQQRDRRGGG